MTEYESLFAEVEWLEKMDGQQEALEQLQKLKQLFPDQKNEILMRILNIMFRQERYEEALDTALEYMEGDDGSILQWLLERYYDPFREESENIRKYNMECLKQYDYFCGAEDLHGVRTLLYDGYEKLVFCDGQMIRRCIGASEIQLENGEVTLVANAFNITCLAEQISKTKYTGEIPDKEIPVYLYYDEDIFHALIQCTEISGLLKNNRAVLLVGEERLRQFFEEQQICFPNQIKGVGIGRIEDILNHQWQVKVKTMCNDKTQIEAYYSVAKEDMDERIRKKKPRILFLTSYFTTALQYHIKNMKRSAEKIGLETELLIERGAIFSMQLFDICGVLNSFRPDIIFLADHFRFEHRDIPKEIVVISWIQDPLPDVMNSLTPAKLGNRDFVLNHFTSWQEFLDLGYPTERMMDAPIPSNQEIYKPYLLTAEEKMRYGCDICFVCHASDVDAHIRNIVMLFQEELQEGIAAVYKGYQSYVYEMGETWYQKQMFRQYVEGAFLQHYRLQLTAYALDFLAKDMYLWFNQRVFREALVDWILDAGFTNIKLYGNGWKTNPKYEPYAMGPAENGETLSKIYQASKIVVGNNVMTTAAARAWETMLSGGFYLSNYIPEEEDATDIRKILTVGEEVIMFYNRDDLIEKLHYYLEHEDERKIMIEKGRKAALEKMTFDSLMKKMLEEVTVCVEED